MPENTLTFTYDSDLEELNKLPDHVDSVIEKLGLNEELNPVLMLALSEGVTNAIKHGNKYDEKKKVKMSCTLKADKRLCCVITDEGPGFNPDEIPDPLAEENLLKPSGRGVYLMKEYAADVKYNEKGNELTICFNLQTV